MFVRKKKVGSHEYYQLVENRRESGKVRQRVLAHLGRYESLEANLEDLERDLAEYRQAARGHREKQEEARKMLPPSWLDENSLGGVRHPHFRDNRTDAADANVSPYMRSRNKADEAERCADVLAGRLKKLAALKQERGA